MWRAYQRLHIHLDPEGGMPGHVDDAADPEPDRADQSQPVTGNVAMAVDPCRQRQPARVQDAVPGCEEALLCRDEVRVRPAIYMTTECHPDPEQACAQVSSISPIGSRDRAPYR